MPDTTVPAPPTQTTQIPMTGAMSTNTRRHAVANLPRLEPGTYLAVEDGDEVAVVPVTEPVTRIGRSLSADLNFDDATVSRRHALVLLEDGVARVVDDRSLNGVELNGDRVTDAVLHHGDVIAVGRIQMRWVQIPPR